jgi:hypothetical protein
MRTIDLGTTKTITLVEKLTTDVTSVTLNNVVDDGSSVVANIDYGVTQSSKQITLWSGDDYTAIGQWTDTDVDKRLLELINAM